MLVAQENVAALGHTEITVPGKVSGCTESGLTDGTKCFTCNEIIIAQTEIPANGHSYNTVVTAPTCTEDGYTTYNCSVCGDSYVSDEVQAEGHSWKDANTESPKTCEKCGATEGEKLSLMEAFWKIIKIFIDFLKKLFESIKLNVGDVLGKK